MYVYVYVYVYVHEYVCVYAYVHVYVCECVCAYVCANVCVYVQAHVATDPCCSLTCLPLSHLPTITRGAQVDRISARSGAEGSLIVAYDPATILSWRFPAAAADGYTPVDLSVVGSGLPDEDQRACLALSHDDRLMVSASTEPDGAG